MRTPEQRERSRLQMAHWRAANPERNRQIYTASNARGGGERQRRYRDRHPERPAAATKRWRLKNLDAALAKGRVAARAYAALHRAQEAERSRDWRKANPEKARELSRNNNGRRRAAGVGHLSKGRIRELFLIQDGQCVACPTSLELGFQVDHIVAIAKGGLHCDANVQLLCPTCNNRKKARDWEEFLAEMRHA